MTFTSAANAPLVPPPLTLCKNLLELAFVAPFLPPPPSSPPAPLLTPPDSTSTLQLPFPTRMLDGSSSTVNLLGVKRPTPSPRPPNGVSVVSEGQSTKPLPLLPSTSSVHPPHSRPDDRAVPEEFRDVSDKYLAAESLARMRRSDDDGQDDGGEPPAYDG